MIYKYKICPNQNCYGAFSVIESAENSTEEPPVKYCQYCGKELIETTKG